MFEQLFYDEQQWVESVETYLKRFNAQLTETDRRVLEFLLWKRVDRFGQTDFTVVGIAEKIGRSDCSVYRSIHKLENFSIVERQDGARKATITISWPEEVGQ